MTTSLERRLEIVNLVGLKGKMHVDELAAYFNMTGATIRADLRFLEINGFIARAHGFALVKHEILSQLSRTQKDNKWSEKPTYEFIADAIYNELEERDTIFIGCSTIIRHSLGLLENLKQSTIVTCDLNLIQNLKDKTGSKFFVTGGRVNTDQMKMTGSQMLDSLKKYRFKKSIVQVDSFNTNSGLFSDDDFDAELIKLLCELSEQIIIVNKSSMFDSNCTFWICECSEIKTVITDSNVSDKTVDSLQSNGIKILKPN